MRDPHFFDFCSVYSDCERYEYFACFIRCDPDCDRHIFIRRYIVSKYKKALNRIKIRKGSRKMQKIMFYTNKPWKRRHWEKRERTGFKLTENSTAVLLFTLYLCGLIMGSILYFTKNAVHPYLTIISEYLISTQIRYLFINEICLQLIFFLFCLFCAYSCVGTIPIVLLSYLKGFYYALIVSKLLASYNIKGLGYFAFILLPGAILSVCVTMAFCNISIQLTRNIGAVILRGESMITEQKKYLSGAGIYLCLLIASVLLDCLFTFLFSGLF